VPSGGGMISQPQTWEVFEGEATETSDTVSESWFMIPL